ncbi:MAG: SDR family NAD(P)-dependent oxidoreductase, partial [Actinomycetota bacterium]|nr:SDR family NAD(P)-dependent oxidoreductase [Actinomycetota bacterium]
MELTGRTAMVTGGSGDIGGAIALALAEAGCDVAVTYVGNESGANDAVAAISALGRTGVAVQLDQR